MPKVVGVKFKKSSRVYYFEAGEFQFEDGIPVIVETARGTEMGYISMLPTEMEDDKIVAPLKPIVRLATKKDVEQIEKLENSLLEANRQQDISRETILDIQENLIANKVDIQTWMSQIQTYIDEGYLVGSDLTRANEILKELQILLLK